MALTLHGYFNHKINLIVNTTNREIKAYKAKYGVNNNIVDGTVRIKTNRQMEWQRYNAYEYVWN